MVTARVASNMTVSRAATGFTGILDKKTEGLADAGFHWF